MEVLELDSCPDFDVIAMEAFQGLSVSDISFEMCLTFRKIDQAFLKIKHF